jgi:hypothetical protein
MIRNGLYALTVRLQDGIEGGGNGVVVLRDGVIRGGDSFFYFVGSYTCCGSKWRGEVTCREHTPALATRPFARKVATIGFTGNYTDVGVDNDNTALLGKQSISFKTSLRLLTADDPEPLTAMEKIHELQF